MPVITMDKGYFIELIGEKLNDEKLTDQITKLGFNVEGITKEEISIEVTSNRPDLIGAIGFARALKHFDHKTTKFHYEIKGKEPELTISVGKKVKNVRPYIAALVVKGLKLNEKGLTDLLSSIDKFTDTYGRMRKKIAIGVHNLDKISGQVIYDAFGNDSYIPLNAIKETSYKDVLEKSEKGMKYSETIEGKLYPALKDEKGTLALIPILNADRTKVTTATKNVLIDITGTSEYMIDKTADLLACNFIDLGAEVKKVQIDYGTEKKVTPEMSTSKVVVQLAQIESDIGVKIGQNNVGSLGAKMGYEMSFTGNSLNFIVPAYRFDVINDQDVIEDIAIAYGYDYIRPVPIKSSQPGSLDPSALYRSRVETVMIGLGFTQMMNSYLSNDASNFTNMRLRLDGAVRIKNPKSDAITIMRTWLIPSLLRNVQLSLKDPMPLKAFELDMAFFMANGKPVERYHLAAVTTDPKANFNSVKAEFETLAQELGIVHGLEEVNHPSFIEGRCAKVIIQGNEIGFFGELHPEVLIKFGIDEATVAFEIEI